MTGVSCIRLLGVWLADTTLLPCLPWWEAIEYEGKVRDGFGLALDVGEERGWAGIGAGKTSRPLRCLWPLGVGSCLACDSPGFCFHVGHWQEGYEALVCNREEGNNYLRR